MKFEYLPNELLIKCFQYMEASDIIYSFDQLIYRFSQLIRNISLKLSFYQFIQSRFEIYEPMIITSLSIIHCDLDDLFQLIKYKSTLKYFRIEYLYDDDVMRKNERNLIDINKINLKQLIINDCQIKFELIQLLLYKMRNLTLFSISSSRMEMIDANLWQHIIEYSLKNLEIFRFCFDYNDNDSYEKKFIKVKQFQTEFWHEHDWNISYEINKYSLMIYTIPFIRKKYQLIADMDKSIAKCNYLNIFDNVKELVLSIRAIKNELLYFANVISLTITCSYDDARQNYLSIEHVKYLNTLVNVSNIKHLKIENTKGLSSSLLRKILYQLSNVDSLMVNKSALLSFLRNRRLSKLLKKKIIKLDISNNDCYNRHNFNWPYYGASSIIEPCEFNIRSVTDFLFILSKLPKLSLIKLGTISPDIHLWIQLNSSRLNIDFSFKFLNDKDNLTRPKSSELDLIIDLLY